MSNKGYPTQKKLTTPLVGFPNSQTTSEFNTLQKTYSDRVGMDTVQMCLYRLHPAVKTATPNTTYPKRIFTSTAHGAQEGDVIRFEVTAANPGFESGVISVPDANTIVLSAETPNNILGTDTFYILRYTTPRVDDSGATIVTVTQGPTQFVYDGTDTEVLQDTAVPANSRPLPVINLDGSGLEIDYATAANQVLEIAELTDINTELDTQTTALGTVNTNLGTINTSLGTIDTSIGSTNTKLDTLIATDFATETTLLSLDGKDFATETTLAALAAEDFATQTTLAALNAKVTAVDTGAVTISGALPAGNNNIGDVDVLSLPSIPAGTNNIGDVDVASLPISFNAGAVDSTTQRVISANTASATLANVSASTSNVTLLASSSTRLGAAFYNDSTSVLYLKFGANASATSFTVILTANAYYELPQPCYSGIIDGIWVAAAGACRVTSW